MTKSRGAEQDRTRVCKKKCALVRELIPDGNAGDFLFCYTAQMKKKTGGCHCGKVRYEVENVAK